MAFLCSVVLVVQLWLLVSLVLLVLVCLLVLPLQLLCVEMCSCSVCVVWDECLFCPTWTEAESSPPPLVKRNRSGYVALISFLS